MSKNGGAVDAKNGSSYLPSKMSKHSHSNTNLEKLLKKDQNAHWFRIDLAERQQPSSKNSSVYKSLGLFNGGQVNGATTYYSQSDTFG